MPENIRVEREEPYAVITLDRPKQLNALTHATFAEIGSALAELEDDPSIRAVIVTGSGTKAFASGADIGELQALRSAEDGSAHSREAHGLLARMEAFPKPIIMAVNGYALGGGCELALAGDIILASENARFGQPEVNLGIIPGFGGSQRLPRLIGRTRALELLLTGRLVGAEEALRLGLVNQVVALEDLLDTAKKLARTIAEKAPLAIALCKKAVYQGLDRSPSDGNRLEIDLFGQAVGTEDRKEGTAAFLEKRTPIWQGK